MRFIGRVKNGKVLYFFLFAQLDQGAYFGGVIVLNDDEIAGRKEGCKLL